MNTDFKTAASDHNGFEKLMRHELENNSAIAAIEFQFSLAKNHGAPCMLTIIPKDDEKRTHNIMQHACYDLNEIPDHIDIRPSEIKQGSNWRHLDLNGSEIDFGEGVKQYPLFRGRHNHCGGSPSIDNIAAQNAIPVLSKFIFGLAERKVLSKEEASEAFRDLFSQIQKTHVELGLPKVSSGRDLYGTYPEKRSSDIENTVCSV